MKDLPNIQANSQKFVYFRGHGRPQSDRDLAINLLKEGCSFRTVARMVGVSHQTISKWFKKHVDSLPQIETKGLNEGVEVDELCTFVKKKSKKHPTV